MLRLSVIALLLAACEQGYPPPRSAVQADEIAALSAQIQEWRRAMGPACDPVRVELLGFAPVGASSTTTDHFASCSAEDDACSVALAICENAESICAIAGQRGNDVWSNDKCVSANRACREARACVQDVAAPPAQRAPWLQGAPQASHSPSFSRSASGMSAFCGIASV